MKSIQNYFVTFLLLLGLNLSGFAQQKPAFGFEKFKTKTDSTRKKSKIFNPEFFRLGLTGGGQLSLGSSSDNEFMPFGGLRGEYGFSKKLSLVGDLQSNAVSAGLNWMPFKSGRLQPYLGFGGGANLQMGDFGKGSDGKEDKDGKKNHNIMEDPNDPNELNGINESDSDSLNAESGDAFAYLRAGVNFVLIPRLVASVETNYNLPFPTSSTNFGAMGLRFAVMYQFGGKRK